MIVMDCKCQALEERLRKLEGSRFDVLNSVNGAMRGIDTRLVDLETANHELEGKREANHELHLGMDGRLRKLEAGLLGLKDQVEKMGARYARLCGRTDLRAQESASLKDEVVRLQERISALEELHSDIAPFDPPLSGCRETAWVVKHASESSLYLFGVNKENGGTAWWRAGCGHGGIEWIRLFGMRHEAEMLAHLLGTGKAVQVYTDTMEEVNP